MRKTQKIDKIFDKEVVFYTEHKTQYYSSEINSKKRHTCY